MSEETMRDDAATDDDDLNTALLYRDRTWTEVENPVQMRMSDADWSEALRRNSWEGSQKIGAADGISIDLYHRRSNAEPCRYRWLVEYNTLDVCKTIVIQRFQDLIDFLAHVSSTMLVVMLPGDFTYVLKDLLDRTPYRVEEKQWAQEQRERDAAAKKKAKP